MAWRQGDRVTGHHRWVIAFENTKTKRRYHHSGRMSQADAERLADEMNKDAENPGHYRFWAEEIQGGNADSSG